METGVEITIQTISMGHGYAFSIASQVGARFPEKVLTFHNRGISGNTISDLELGVVGSFLNPSSKAQGPWSVAHRPLPDQPSPGA